MKKMFENKTRKMIVTLAVGLLLSVVLSAGVVAANPIVLGKVTQEGTDVGLVGADVTAYCGGCERSTTTTTDGYYEVNFGECSACGEGDTVNVEATYSGNTGSGSGRVLSASMSGFLTVNFSVVCVDIPIPEFATIAIPAAGILGLLLFFNHRKHKKE